jgi:hypothetical protein
VELGAGTRLVQAGLGREAAAAGIVDLMNVAHQLGGEALDRVGPALGNTVTSITHGSHANAGKVLVRVDEGAVLADGAGAGLLDTLRGTEELFVEAAARADVLGDARMARMLQTGAADARHASFFVDSGVKAALMRARGLVQPHQWAEPSVVAPSSIVPASSRSPHGWSEVRDLVRSMTHQARGAALLADDASSRVAELEVVDSAVATARSAAAGLVTTGDRAGAVARLTGAADELVEHARRLRREELVTAFAAEPDALRVDVLALDRIQTATTHSVASARTLVEEAGAIVRAGGDAFAELRGRVDIASDEISKLAAAISKRDGLVDTLVRGGSPTARFIQHPRGYTGTSAVRLADGTTPDVRVAEQTDWMFAGGTFREPRLRREASRDLGRTVQRILGTRTDPATDGLSELASRAAAMSGGANDVGGASALASAREAIARTQARFGSAEDLRAALDAARDGAAAPRALG